MIVISFQSTIVIYRMVVISSSLAKDYGFTNTNLFISFTSGIMNLFCIQLLNWVGISVSLILIITIHIQREAKGLLVFYDVGCYLFNFLPRIIFFFFCRIWRRKKNVILILFSLSKEELK